MQGRFSLPYQIVRCHVGIRDSVDDCRTWPLGQRYEAPLRNIVQWLPSIESLLDARHKPAGLEDNAVLTVLQNRVRSCRATLGVLSFKQGRAHGFYANREAVRSGRLSARSVLQPRDQLDCFLNLNITRCLTAQCPDRARPPVERYCPIAKQADSGFKQLGGNHLHWWGGKCLVFIESLIAKASASKASASLASSLQSPEAG